MNRRGFIGRLVLLIIGLCSFKGVAKAVTPVETPKFDFTLLDTRLQHSVVVDKNGFSQVVTMGSCTFMFKGDGNLGDIKDNFLNYLRDKFQFMNTMDVGYKRVSSSYAFDPPTLCSGVYKINRSEKVTVHSPIRLTKLDFKFVDEQIVRKA